MAAMTNRVVEEALSLPADARLSLVARLLTSLNLPLDEEIERLWAEQAERRVSQIEAGKANLVPGRDVFRKVRAKHGKLAGQKMSRSRGCSRPGFHRPR
jgi:hypothetical protein